MAISLQLSGVVVMFYLFVRKRTRASHQTHMFNCKAQVVDNTKCATEEKSRRDKCKELLRRVRIVFKNFLT